MSSTSHPGSAPSLRPHFSDVLKLAETCGKEQVWASIQDSSMNVDTRDLFTYALILYERDKHLDRVTTLLTLAKEVQHSDGNFNWTLSGTTPNTMHNAVEFCMLGGSMLWLRHRDKLSEEVGGALKQIITPALGACVEHLVPRKYANIALLNAMNLILLGESLNLPDIAATGYTRLEQFCIYTWEWGIHEFISPTYTAIQLVALGLIEAYTTHAAARKQAQALLELWWGDIALNWLELPQRLGGAESRVTMPFMSGEGGIDGVAWLAGWNLPLPNGKTVPNLGNPSMDIVYAALMKWQPTKQKTWMERVNRLKPDACMNLQQGWGAGQNQTRTYFRKGAVALSSIGAGYNYPTNDDVPLTVDFNVHNHLQANSTSSTNIQVPSNPASTLLNNQFYPGRCYFLPAFVQDMRVPFFRQSDHPTPLLWTAAQQEGDALALVLYDNEQLDNSSPHQQVESDFFILGMNIDDDLWVDGQPCAMNNPNAITVGNQEPVVYRTSCKLGDPNVWMALGLQAVWWPTSCTASLSYVSPKEDDASYKGPLNRFDFLQLTINHVAEPTPTKGYGGAALWLQIGTGLESDKGSFAAWRNAFETGKLESSQGTLGKGCDLKIWSDQNSDLSLSVVSPDLNRFEATLRPGPSHTVLQPQGEAFEDVKGRDWGREILMDVVQDYQKALEDCPQVHIPGELSVKQARVWQPMSEVTELGTSYACLSSYALINIPQTDSDEGSITWVLDVPKEESYYVWGRVKNLSLDDTPSQRSSKAAPLGNTPIPQSSSERPLFLVRFFQDITSPICFKPWWPEPDAVGASWRWIRMGLSELGPVSGGSPVNLPKGKMKFQLFPRTLNIALAGVWVTSDAKQAPPMGTK